MTQIRTGKFSFLIRRLEPGEANRFTELNQMFSQAFGDPNSFDMAKPTKGYLESLLQKPHVIPLVALTDNKVAGGLVAYVLDKFEQERSEIYIYDLAVREEYRRRGIARSLISELKKIAKKIGAWVIYVQADKEEADLPARQLYESMGVREDVFHYDITIT